MTPSLLCALALASPLAGDEGVSIAQLRHAVARARVTLFAPSTLHTLPTTFCPNESGRVNASAAVSPMLIRSSTRSSSSSSSVGRSGGTESGDLGGRLCGEASIRLGGPCATYYVAPLGAADEVWLCLTPRSLNPKPSSASCSSVRAKLYCEQMQPIPPALSTPSALARRPPESQQQQQQQQQQRQAARAHLVAASYAATSAPPPSSSVPHGGASNISSHSSHSDGDGGGDDPAPHAADASHVTCGAARVNVAWWFGGAVFGVVCVPFFWCVVVPASLWLVCACVWLSIGVAPFVTTYDDNGDKDPEPLSPTPRSPGHEAAQSFAFLDEPKRT